jgi:HD-GYP domain-containing protein (c-di-GMP phosphodiesterase class II)
MHDIGKAAIPATILSKPGNLTQEEWVLMRSHVTRGHEMLKEMNLPDFALDMMLNHHERMDGSGYPRGLLGPEMSLETKILGICDVVEAMGSHRPYRPARSSREIIQELSEGKGIRYDLDLAELIINMIQTNELSIGSQSGQFIAANK